MIRLPLRRIAPLAIAATVALTLTLGTTPATATASAPPRTDRVTAAQDAPQITRFAGQSRYETAVAVAQRLPAGQRAVFVATGADFPDALSAAAVAGSGWGPILLTPRTWIPESVLAEVARLAPEQVYVLGGPSVVSESVREQLAEIAPTTRIHGLNRYETSRLLAARFHPQADELILATGRGHADALAASAAAGSRRIPALLVDGAKPSLDAPTLTLVTATAPRTIWLAGGHGAISIGIEQQLRTAGYAVRRYGGETRYETAAMITAAFRPEAPRSVWFATGEDFPDALTAAAAAPQDGGILLLSRNACTPRHAQEALRPDAALPRLAVGGRAVLSDASLGGSGCGEPAPVRPAWLTTGFEFSTTAAEPYRDRPPVNVHDPAIVLDATGLRVMNFGPGGSRADHPVAYAQYGLSALLEYQSTGDQVWLQRALRHAERLVEIHTDRAEAWFYPYLFDWTSQQGTLRAPWFSAMAQGEALSLFVRLHRETGDASWRTAAEHTWQSFLQPRSAAQPWATGVERGQLWFEEYVGNLPPLKVLNGHIFALFGVYDYWRLTGDRTALRYLDGATTTVLEVMPRIRIPGKVSYYCWASVCKTVAWQNWRYHSIHSWQLDTLARLTDDTRFTTWSNRLRSDWVPPAGRSLAPSWIEPLHDEFDPEP